MFASQTRDLYHIETVRKGGYIEFAVRQIYRAEPSEAYRQIASVDTDAVLRKAELRTTTRLSFFDQAIKVTQAEPSPVGEGGPR